MLKTIYVCETCGRFDVKPLAPNHFKPDVHDGVCGAQSGAIPYVRQSLADELAEALASTGLSERTENVLIRYREVVHP